MEPVSQRSGTVWNRSGTRSGTRSGAGPFENVRSELLVYKLARQPLKTIVQREGKGWAGSNMFTPKQNKGSRSTTQRKWSKGSGSSVWITGLDCQAWIGLDREVWIGLDRRSGSPVGFGGCSGPQILTCSYILMHIFTIYKKLTIVYWMDKYCAYNDSISNIIHHNYGHWILP